MSESDLLQENQSTDKKAERNDASAELQPRIDLQELEKTEDGQKFQLKFDIPVELHSRIIGGKGKKKKLLEKETGTKVKVPKLGSSATCITIRGNTREDVLSAKERLEIIIKAPSNATARQKFTHFVSIPFTAHEMKSNFIRFRDEILADSETYGLDKSLFYKPEKLHLTVVMLSLSDSQDEESALKSLQDCKELIIDQILQGKLLTVAVRGVDVMNEKPTSANIIYGKVISDELQQITNEISKKFPNHETMQRGHVKLHVTLINTSKSKKCRRKFDATKILENFNNYDFGLITINEIHISQLVVTSSNGYYGASGIVKCH